MIQSLTTWILEVDSRLQVVHGTVICENKSYQFYINLQKRINHTVEKVKATDSVDPLFFSTGMVAEAHSKLGFFFQ